MGFLIKYINIPVFIISLAFGIFAVYITMPDSRKIYVYPSPDNVNVLQYRDKTNTCFSFKQHQVSCPKNESDIFKIPTQS
jgi:ribose/xylose/arabinose/galactoside ABC-type transport system permease subunit